MACGDRYFTTSIDAAEASTFPMISEISAGCDQMAMFSILASPGQRIAAETDALPHAAQ
jgi:hypothetical protein